MEHITTREQLHALARKLAISPDWVPSPTGLTAKVRGKVLDSTGTWGAHAEGEAIVELINPNEVEQYVIVQSGGKSIAEVNLASMLGWAGNHDPELIKRIGELGEYLAANRKALEDVLRNIGDDPVWTWPTEVMDTGDYEVHDDALRCLAQVPTGKLGAYGRPQGRDCLALIDGCNILELTASLREHIAAVEHLPAES
jgi:hypothetical protein